MTDAEPLTTQERIDRAMANQACTDDLRRVIPQHPAPAWDDAQQQAYFARLDRTAADFGRLALMDAVLSLPEHQPARRQTPE